MAGTVPSHNTDHLRSHIHTHAHTCAQVAVPLFLSFYIYTGARTRAFLHTNRLAGGRHTGHHRLSEARPLCKFMHVHIHIIIQIHTHAYIHTYIPTNTRAYLHARIHTCTHIITRAYVYIHTQTRTHSGCTLSTHTYTNTYIYVFIHIHSKATSLHPIARRCHIIHILTDTHSLSLIHSGSRPTAHCSSTTASQWV